MYTRVAEINSLKIYPHGSINKDRDEDLCASFTETATVIVKIGDEEYTFNDCLIDVYEPVEKIYEVAGYESIDADKLKAEHGKHIYTVDKER